MARIYANAFLRIVTISLSIHEWLGTGQVQGCDVTFESSCYVFNCFQVTVANDFRSWTQVNSECVNSGGHLASFTSEGEFQAVGQADLSGCQDYFVGIKRDADQQRGDAGSWTGWTWSSDETDPIGSWLVWDSSEPNIGDSDAAGVYLSFASGTMYDVQQDAVAPSPHGYICETSVPVQTTPQMSTEVHTSVGIPSTVVTSDVTLTDKQTTGYQSSVKDTTTGIITETIDTTEVDGASAGRTITAVNEESTGNTTTEFHEASTRNTTEIYEASTRNTTTEVFVTTSAGNNGIHPLTDVENSPISAIHRPTTDSDSVLTDLVVTGSEKSPAPSNTNSPNVSPSKNLNSNSSPTTTETINGLEVQLQSIMDEEQMRMSEFLDRSISTYQVSSDECDGNITRYNDIGQQPLTTTVIISKSVQQNGVFRVETNVTTNHDDVIVYSVYWKTVTVNQPVDVNEGGSGMYSMFSGIMSYTLYAGPDYSQESSDVTLTFWHSPESLSNRTLKDNEEAVRVCSFWNETQSSFSMYGCTTNDDAADHVICYCSHTTNFAMLVQVTENKPEGVHESVLKYITIIGLSISLLALIVTLSVYIFLWDLWKCLRNNIHKNLVTCMIVFNGLFLFGADRTENEDSCRVIAIILHYSLLCMFTWMAAEAVYILDKVVRKTTSKWNKMRYYLIVCYAIPAIIVAITTASSLNNYATASTCWLDVANGAIYAFLVPMYSILLFNLLVTIKAVNVIYERSKGKVSSYPMESSSGQTQAKKKAKEPAAGNAIKATHKAEAQQMKRTLRGMVILIPIFGLTWLFAMFAFDSDQLFFQYLFAISNSLQGVFVFVVYCLQDNKTVEAWNRKTGRIKRLNDMKSVEKTNNTCI